MLAGLVVAGAILGGLAAGGALATWYAWRGMWDPYYFGIFAVTARIGAVLGAVLGPACAFVLLRRVPLWLALLGPTLATYVGGVAGEAAGSVGFLTAPVAFLAAVLVLHARGSAPRRRDLERSRPGTLPRSGAGALGGSDGSAGRAVPGPDAVRAPRV